MKLNSKEKNIFICSDSHRGHSNLITKLSTWKTGAIRDFESVEHHDDTLINNINKTVGQDDILFMLGDVAFGGVDNVKSFMDKIICNERHLVLGNHDRHIKNNKNGIQSCFTSIHTYLEINVDGDDFVLFHYPIKEWNNVHKGSYMLHGHCHSLPKDKFFNGGRSMDVGFDGHPEFRPYNIMEIVTLLKDKPLLTHH